MVELWVPLTTDMITLGDVINQGAITSFGDNQLLPDDFNLECQVALLEDGKYSEVARARTVSIHQQIIVTNEEPAPASLLAKDLAVKTYVPAQKLCDARQAGCIAKVERFLERAAQMGIAVKKSGVLPPLVGMNRQTVLKTLNKDKQVSLDCKQVIKLEKFAERHLADNLNGLQREIDALKPEELQEEPGEEVAPPKKRSRTDYCGAAKAFFEGSFDAWHAERGEGRKQYVEQMLKEAQALGQMEALKAENWTVGTIGTAMTNILRRRNKEHAPGGGAA